MDFCVVVPSPLPTSLSQASLPPPTSHFPLAISPHTANSCPGKVWPSHRFCPRGLGTDVHFTIVLLVSHPQCSHHHRHHPPQSANGVPPITARVSESPACVAVAAHRVGEQGSQQINEPLGPDVFKVVGLVVGLRGHIKQGLRDPIPSQ